MCDEKERRREAVAVLNGMVVFGACFQLVYVSPCCSLHTSPWSSRDFWAGG